MIDLHSHILPGIDDGARTLEDSVELCRAAARDGVTTIVATPHIREGRWDNRRSGIASRVDELRAELARRGVPLEVVLGAEVYFACGVLEALQEGAFPTYADGRRYFLFELPNHFIARQVQDLIFECRTAGITPVVAHPERNPQLMASPELLEEVARMGVLFQVTAMSVTGRFGREARKGADQLLARGLVHVVASDAHNASSRPAVLSEAYARVASTWGEERARELFVANPARVLAGEEVDTTLPPPPRAGGLRALFARVFAG